VQKAPPLKEFFRYPITSLMALGAIGLSIPYWYGVDIRPLASAPGVVVTEPWRLVTTVFPHLSLIHLAFNLCWLWVMGTLLERIFGSARFLVVVLLLAVSSSAAETTASEAGVGLSGVVYGFFGILWALKRRPGFENILDQRTIRLFVAWFFICILTTYLRVMHVGNVAHGAGAAVGFLLGMCAGAQGSRRWGLGALLAAVVSGMLAGAWAAPAWLRLDPEYAASVLAREGYDELKAGRDGAAAEHFGLAARLNPRDAIIWYDYGMALHRLKREREAFDAYVNAARLDPRPEVRRTVAELGARLAGLAIHASDPLEARSILKSAAEVEPDDSKLWMWAGIEKWMSGDGAGAIRALEKALALDPSNEDAKKQLQFVREGMK
jgi:membrane associated rhomboid family serine protease